jgi:energy-coupling factor transport system permease protein
MNDGMVFQFRKGNSFVHKLDGVTKVIVLFAASLIVFANFILWFQGLILIICLLIGRFAAKLSFSEIFRGTKWLLFACLCFFVAQTLLLDSKGASHLLFNLFKKPIYYEVVDYTAAVSFRIYTIFLVSFIFIRTTHPRDLVVSFVEILGIGYRIPYAFFIALRIVPIIENESRCIREAHMVRGIGRKGGLKGKVEELRRYTIPLLVRSLQNAQVMTHSMENRGFGLYKKRTYVNSIKMSLAGKLVSAFSIFIVILVYVFVFTGVLPFQYAAY